MAPVAPSLGTQRPLIAQQFRTFSFLAGVARLPIDPASDKSKLITTFIVSNPVTSANSVFIGDGGVATTTGLEIPAGAAPVFRVEQEGRQFYEIQSLLISIAERLECKPVQLTALPFIVWDLSQVFLVAAAPTTVSIMVFQQMYL